MKAGREIVPLDCVFRAFVADKEEREAPDKPANIASLICTTIAVCAKRAHRDQNESRRGRGARAWV